MAADGVIEQRVSAQVVVTVRTIPVFAFGLALSWFLAISYVSCVLGYVLFPGLPINHAVLTLFFPGFAQLTWSLFLVGLLESFAWGWYVALIFGPLYNFFAWRWR